MRRAGKPLIAVVLAAILIGAGVAGFVVVGWWQEELNRPFKGYLEPEIVVRIPRGESLSRIADRLEEAGIIRSSKVLRFYYRIDPDSTHLLAGDYRFSDPVSLRQVIERLRSGDTVRTRVTIPEGYDLVQIMVAMVEAGLGTIDGFGDAISRAELITDLDPEAGDLEGYLLPDTYFFSPGADENEIVETMVSNFRKVWNPSRQARARGLGMSVREVVTLASLIEKETGLEKERPLVSAVFHNRLRRGMRLACDPTVIFAVRTLKEYDGIIHQSDLRIDSPYNTYLYPGLPPGPIASPGVASLEAALNPADSEHLFFVSRNDGSHVFSNDYREHERAVQRYQR